MYLDPPFNSDGTYNVIFSHDAHEGNGAAAQVEAFDDTWHWTPAANFGSNRASLAARSMGRAVSEVFPVDAKCGCSGGAHPRASADRNERKATVRLAVIFAGAAPS